MSSSEKKEDQGKRCRRLSIHDIDEVPIRKYSNPCPWVRGPSNSPTQPKPSGVTTDIRIQTEPSVPGPSVPKVSPSLRPVHCRRLSIDEIDAVPERRRSIPSPWLKRPDDGLPVPKRARTDGTVKEQPAPAAVKKCAIQKNKEEVCATLKPISSAIANLPSRDALKIDSPRWKSPWNSATVDAQSSPGACRPLVRRPVTPDTRHQTSV